VNELTFRGKDGHRRAAWSRLGLVGGVLGAELALTARFWGPAGYVWLLGLPAVLTGSIVHASMRSWSTVGAAGVTIRRGFGRAHTHPWHEIQWIDVAFSGTRTGQTRAARIHLTDGRRRFLPGLSDSGYARNPDFVANVQQVIDWWVLSTDEHARIRPPRRPADRLTPGVAMAIVMVIIVALFALLYVALPSGSPKPGSLAPFQATRGQTR
jgi:hypothetical protein